LRLNGPQLSIAIRQCPTSRASWHCWTATTTSRPSCARCARRSNRLLGPHLVRAASS